MNLMKEELDGSGELFGWKFSDGGSTGLVTIYVEDDENWYPEMTFDKYWLDDLLKAVADMKTQSLTTVVKGLAK